MWALKRSLLCVGRVNNSVVGAYELLHVEKDEKNERNWISERNLETYELPQKEHGYLRERSRLMGAGY
jgi:hypothetical protein